MLWENLREEEFKEAIEKSKGCRHRKDGHRNLIKTVMPDRLICRAFSCIFCKVVVVCNHLEQS